MGEIVTGHDTRTGFPLIQWPTVYDYKVMVSSLRFPDGIGSDGHKSRCCLRLRRMAFSRLIQAKGHIFPASGYRNNSSGDLNNVGSNGYCWSATPNDGNNGRQFNFNSSSWNLNNNNRTIGYPVRAVAALTCQESLPLLFLAAHGHHGTTDKRGFVSGLF